MSAIIQASLRGQFLLTALQIQGCLINQKQRKGDMYLYLTTSTFLA